MRPLKRQVALGLLAGGLLPLPLVLALSFLHPGTRLPTPDNSRVSPELSFEERMQRVTYHRHCQKTSDCEPPMGCLGDPRVFTHYCTDSECTTDAQCPDGLLCREVTTIDNGPLVRLCLPLGFRKEGERCMELPPDRDYACGSGLVCAGFRQSWCGRPCQLNDAASCPEGSFCADLSPQPICVPSCETRGCPEGQHCVRFESGASQCVKVYGPHCQQTPCPDNRECRVETGIKVPGRVWMECVQECGKSHPPCPDGLICDRWRCLPPCDPNIPGMCGEGYRCARGKRPARPWVCKPEE